MLRGWKALDKTECSSLWSEEVSPVMRDMMVLSETSGAAGGADLEDSVSWRSSDGMV